MKKKQKSNTYNQSSKKLANTLIKKLILAIVKKWQLL